MLLVAEAMRMNYAFWSQQGGDAVTGRMLGEVSIAIDVFQAILPLIIQNAWIDSNRPGYVVATVFLCACLVFTFVGAIGFAEASRGTAIGNRQAVSLRYTAAVHDKVVAEARITKLGNIRPQAVIEEAMVLPP